MRTEYEETVRQPVHVALRGVSKNFGGTQAVRELDLEVVRGSVHAIVGENGAGKSTVAKMIAGVIVPNEGGLAIDGQPVSLDTPRHALAAGIAMIEQELALVDEFSVIENVFLGAEARNGPWLAPGAERRRYDELVSQTGFALDPDVPVKTLRVADQQKVEIMRAIARKAELIIMDEPTARLAADECDRLYAVIRSLRESGTTILYISHFLEEVLLLADTVTVMRDGRHVSTSAAGRETPDTLVQGMLGRSLDLAFPERTPNGNAAAPLLEVRNLTATGRFSDIAFAVRPGEIIGLAGLVGSGRTEILRVLAGADRHDGGEILLDGRPVSWRAPRDAIAEGVVMLTENRKDQGLIPGATVAQNTTLGHLDKASRWGFISDKKERRQVEEMMRSLDIRAIGPDAPIETLSGGNQQKVMLARCLVGNPRVLLIDEPTRGVDVGAKRALYALIVDLAARGMAVLMVSSELDEVLGLADRVIVLRRGRIEAEMTAEEASEENVLAAAFGTQGELLDTSPVPHHDSRTER